MLFSPSLRTTRKEIITNADGERIVALVEEVRNPLGTLLVVHGIGGYKEQPILEAVAHAGLAESFNVVRFDARHTFGESHGHASQSTVTALLNDLGVVVDWLSSVHVAGPLILVGHSAGAFCVGRYITEHPHAAQGLIMIAPMVSGPLSLQALETKEPHALEIWQKRNARELLAQGKEGRALLPWSHAQDRLEHDLIKHAHRIRVPTLVIVGERDYTAPPDHARMLVQSLTTNYEYSVVERASHLFKRDQDLAKIGEVVAQWIRSQ